jgi:hypothetical protein
LIRRGVDSSKKAIQNRNTGAGETKTSGSKATSDNEKAR